MTRAFRGCHILALLAVACGGCDPVEPDVVAPQGNTRERAATLKVVAPLLPGRATHVAVDSTGTVFWVQESSDAHDAVLSLGPGDVPVATGVSSRTILRALGVRDAGATGTIQSLCAGANDYVYFYFAGGTRREPVHAIGRFRRDGEELDIVVSPETLARETGFGASIDLARGTLFGSSSDHTPWLWLRHLDRSTLMRVELKPAGPVEVGPDRARLVRPFDTVRTEDDEPMPLTRPEYQLAAAPDGALVLLDAWLGAVWRIDSTTGRMRIARSLVGLPRTVSAPLFDKDGNLLLAFGDGPVFEAKVEAMVADPIVRTTWPAVLVLTSPTDKRVRSPWARWTSEVDTFSGRSLEFSAPLDAKTWTPVEADAELGMTRWITYDSASGALVRLSVERGQ